MFCLVLLLSLYYINDMGLLIEPGFVNTKRERERERERGGREGEKDGGGGGEEKNTKAFDWKPHKSMSNPH